MSRGLSISAPVYALTIDESCRFKHGHWVRLHLGVFRVPYSKVIQ